MVLCLDIRNEILTVEGGNENISSVEKFLASSSINKTLWLSDCNWAVYCRSLTALLLSRFLSASKRLSGYPRDNKNAHIFFSRMTLILLSFLIVIGLHISPFSPALLNRLL